MKKPILTLVTVLLCASVGFSADKPAPKAAGRKISSQWCVTQKFKAKVNTLEEMRSTFDSIERNDLIQMFWGEAQKAKPDPILVGLAQYLAYTEQKSAVSGYYQAMAMAAGAKVPLNDEIEQWPNVSKLKKVKTSLNEMCELYLAAGGDDF